MVVHTPSKLDVLRQEAAARRRVSIEVPPSVRAAGATAGEVDAAIAAAGPSVGDLLLPEQPVVQPAAQPAAEQHDFDLWDGDTPPGLNIQAQVHAAEGQGHVNVTTRTIKNSVKLTEGAEEDTTAEDNTDRISVAGSVSDVTLSLIHI